MEPQEKKHRNAASDSGTAQEITTTSASTWYRWGLCLEAEEDTPKQAERRKEQLFFFFLLPGWQRKNERGEKRRRDMANTSPCRLGVVGGWTQLFHDAVCSRNGPISRSSFFHVGDTKREIVVGPGERPGL